MPVSLRFAIVKYTLVRERSSDPPSIGSHTIAAAAAPSPRQVRQPLGGTNAKQALVTALRLQIVEPDCWRWDWRQLNPLPGRSRPSNFWSAMAAFPSVAGFSTNGQAALTNGSSALLKSWGEAFSPKVQAECVAAWARATQVSTPTLGSNATGIEADVRK